MKQILKILFFLLGTTCFSQDTEFGKSQNGLIYSEATVKHLKHIVDSLNLKFKDCDLSKRYLSKFQTKAHFISLENEQVNDAKMDIEANISFDDFIKKYSKSEVEMELLVVKFKYKNYEKKDVVKFSSIGLSDKYDHEFIFTENLSNYDKPFKGKWIFKYYEKTNYSSESIDAFYFIEEFSQHPIPEIYSRMIQYSDCMIDTSTQVFFEKAHNNRNEAGYENEKSSKLQEFWDYIYKSTAKPELNDEDLENSIIKYQIWDSLRMSRVDSLRKNDEKFDNLLNEAIIETLTTGKSNDQFEEYVGLYYSKKTALELKRNRIVVGSCSQDNSPRIHALNIAKLSAETGNWEIFLRSHLNIINDRFERASDGSYAWERRKTYIKELEVLDINVLDLLLGISLRIENPSNNHYYGSIGRLGRALSETDKPSEIEAKMLQMISDTELDDYNRILIYYLFQNYNNCLDNKDKQAKNNEELTKAVNAFPNTFRSKKN